MHVARRVDPAGGVMGGCSDCGGRWWWCRDDHSSFCCGGCVCRPPVAVGWWPYAQSISNNR
jgi:hypothetical protein